MKEAVVLSENIKVIYGNEEYISWDCGDSVDEVLNYIGGRIMYILYDDTDRVCCHECIMSACYDDITDFNDGPSKEEVMLAVNHDMDSELIVLYYKYANGCLEYKVDVVNYCDYLANIFMNKYVEGAYVYDMPNLKSRFTR